MTKKVNFSIGEWAVTFQKALINEGLISKPDDYTIESIIDCANDWEGDDAVDQTMTLEEAVKKEVEAYRPHVVIKNFEPTSKRVASFFHKELEGNKIGWNVMEVLPDGSKVCYSPNQQEYDIFALIKDDKILIHANGENALQVVYDFAGVGDRKPTFTREELDAKVYPMVSMFVTKEFLEEPFPDINFYGDIEEEALFIYDCLLLQIQKQRNEPMQKLMQMLMGGN